LRRWQIVFTVIDAGAPFERLLAPPIPDLCASHTG
jgi:hypothetical protein